MEIDCFVLAERLGKHECVAARECEESRRVDRLRLV